ncbi:sigma-70 family RNA polymerase sigma factor [Gilvimarinus sp. SDUM040013]|uniref:Sigma-70 family RNA polymerase sigma factor n=1 Tax=Gilvimarinus gilvus TaxID=3058038 RepID=A0ABU4RY00_9GAMM|nr:sigma-70 family RNA polymerase sigma factor [Gilvimarinus sp. SDUM040013]MDO3386228.1 sigma-70 family RNA polymerase sigma factor [Gilvimarinus sp. SDUM040013]MDX6849777.1 sigma-70 family RNA polymerase sigma factor [Gilvimarinus sp. SDUM040013]
MSTESTVEHVFRHEYGKLVAALCGRFGLAQLGMIEDAVQFAMLQAVEYWNKPKVPDNAAAWLYKVAYRFALSQLAKQQRRKQITEQFDALETATESATNVESPLSGELDDDLLKMLFVACGESIPLESRLVFTLKTLCGFSINEVASRLFITSGNAYKRFTRAKVGLRDQALTIDDLTEQELTQRLESVQYVLYLIFTEGSLSSSENDAIRVDFCEEAIRLTNILANSRVGKAPSTTALLALMSLHFARLASRTKGNGELQLLSQQNRNTWNTQWIERGLLLLSQASVGDTISRYHVEAGVAAEHCLAKSFAETRWDRIVDAYRLLESIDSSPMHRLNHAIALAEWKGAEHGLALIEQHDFPDWLQRSYHWHAVLADLYYRCSQRGVAQQHYSKALQLAPSSHIEKLLGERFGGY